MQQRYQAACDLLSKGKEQLLEGIQQLALLIEEGCADASMTLATVKLKSSPPGYDPKGAIHILESLDEDNSGVRCFMLAEALCSIWYKDNLANHTLEKIKDYYLQSATLGHVEAMLQLAYGYRHQLFVDESKDFGFSWLQKAVDKKHPRAFFELGVHYLEGMGCGANQQLAHQMFSKAAEFNYPNAVAYLNKKVDVGDKLSGSTKITSKHLKPKIEIAERLLDAMECSHLAVLSLPHLRPSKVISNSGEGRRVEGRSSMGTNFPEFRSDFVIFSIVRRLSQRVEMKATQAEALELLKYGEGDEYRVHPDYFNPKLDGHQKIMGKGGQRVKTIVCYLNTVEEGGGTYFPDLDITSTAVAGNGVIFENADVDGKIYTASRHAGLPVIKGSKWIVTLWFRQNDV